MLAAKAADVPEVGGLTLLKGWLLLLSMCESRVISLSLSSRLMDVPFPAVRTWITARPESGDSRGVPFPEASSSM